MRENGPKNYQNRFFLDLLKNLVASFFSICYILKVILGANYYTNPVFAKNLIPESYLE